MIIYTSVWGSEYIEYFERGLLASFKWPQNRAEVEQAHWIIGCKGGVEDNLRLRALVKDVCPSVEIVALDLYPGVQHAVRAAKHTGRPFLMAPPDNVFSEGSIRSFRTVGAQRGTCVATAHVRVLPSYLDDAENHRTPGEMLNHAWRHLHDSWTLSNVKRGKSVSFHGGVFWQWIDETTMAVQHRLPTIFLSNITEEDVHFFDRHNCLGTWDNVWPTTNLIQQQRYRYLGSSEAGFVVELTHPSRNVPLVRDINEIEPDQFYGNALHNWINREFVSIFKFKEPV